MKKIILRSTAVLFIFAFFALPACEFLEDCGTCQLIVEVDGVVDEDLSGVPIPFCGDQLIQKQNSELTVIGNQVSYWDCW